MTSQRPRSVRKRRLVAILAGIAGLAACGTYVYFSREQLDAKLLTKLPPGVAFVPRSQFASKPIHQPPLAWRQAIAIPLALRAAIEVRQRSRNVRLHNLDRPAQKPHEIRQIWPLHVLDERMGDT